VEAGGAQRSGVGPLKSLRVARCASMLEGKPRGSSENLRQLFRKSALRPLWLGFATSRPSGSSTLSGPWLRAGWWRRSPGARGLRRVRTQKLVFEGRAVKSADDGLHLLLIGRLDEGEAFRLLRFRIADDLDGICHKAFRVEPGLNIVRGHPDGKVAKKDSETHSVKFITPLVELPVGCSWEAKPFALPIS